MTLPVLLHTTKDKALLCSVSTPAHTKRGWKKGRGEGHGRMMETEQQQWPC